MKKQILIAGMAIGLSVLISIPAFASGWQENETGWWYGTNADNSIWYSNGWQWIDGNGDGIAECYYFDGNGYMAANSVIDGSAVDGNGAWMVNGVVQTKQVDFQQIEETTQTSDDAKEFLQINNAINKAIDEYNKKEAAEWFKNMPPYGENAPTSGGNSDSWQFPATQEDEANTDDSPEIPVGLGGGWDGNSGRQFEVPDVAV